MNRMSSSGRPRSPPRFEKELAGAVVGRESERGDRTSEGGMQWVRNPAAVEEIIAYLEKRRAYIPNYQQRQRAGLWIASTRVEKYNDWAVSG